jgi:hypothetical protein
MDSPTIFIGSFNINGTTITQVEADAWLGEVKRASIVVLGFQECAVRPTVTVGTVDLPEGQQLLQSTNGSSSAYLCSTETDDEADRALCEPIQTALGDIYTKIVDVAMGAPPNNDKVGLQCSDYVQLLTCICHFALGR